MRTKNLTKYDTRYLRKLFMACEKKVSFVYMGACEHTIHAFHQNRHVTIKSSRNGRASGYAWYNCGDIVMKLPPPNSLHLGKFKSTNKVSARRIAQIYLHEIGHNLGLKHNQQIPSYKIDVAFWPDETIPIKEKPKKPKPNIVELRAAKAQKKLTEWQKKLTRAKTYVKKYQRKVHYYEKKKAANT